MRNGHGVSIRAVGAGWLVDFAVQIALGMVIYLTLAGVAAMSEHVAKPSYQDLQALGKRWAESLSFRAAEVFPALLGPMLGGFVAALIGRRFPLTHALLVGVLSALTGASMTVVALVAGWSPEGPGLFYIVLWLLAIPAALIGGQLWNLRSSRV
jgi:hypothetical protein